VRSGALGCTTGITRILVTAATRGGCLFPAAGNVAFCNLALCATRRAARPSRDQTWSRNVEACERMAVHREQVCYRL